MSKAIVRLDMSIAGIPLYIEVDRRDIEILKDKSRYILKDIMKNKCLGVYITDSSSPQPRENKDEV